MKKIYVDLDGTTFNTIKRIVELYDLEFSNHPDYTRVHWTEINSWEFTELKCTNREYINEYFDDKRFFDNLDFMDNAKPILNTLSKQYEIIFISMGTDKNLQLKEKWVEDNLPFAKFIGCNFKDYSDKSHIDMTGGILIDDSFNNLQTSSAKIKICFGDIYKWNENNTYKRCYNWFDVATYINFEC